MSQLHPFAGVLPAACTQFTENEAVDHDATLAHLDAMIDAGVHGMVMLGTVGENYALTGDEKIELLRKTVAHLKGRVPVITGVAETTTKSAVDFTKAAADVGVDGFMVMPALVYVSDVRENVHHFKSVAAASDRPVMIYNNPVSYRVDLRPDDFKHLADIDNVVAIKESSNDPRRITDLFNAHGDRFSLLCGVDDLVMESFILGATGWISGLVNAFPAENRLLWDLMKANRWDEAREVYRWYTPLLHLDTLPKLVQYIKLASQECGYGNERCRAPRLDIEGEERERVLGMIRHAKANRPEIQV
ncbi:MAG: dihydrodipicolinate synthase family protein [Planctomycetota bacterium]